MVGTMRNPPLRSCRRVAYDEPQNDLAARSCLVLNPIVAFRREQATAMTLSSLIFQPRLHVQHTDVLIAVLNKRWPMASSSPVCHGQGLAELVQLRMTVKVCTGDADAGEVESMCAQEQVLPHVRIFVRLSTTPWPLRS